MRGRRPSAGRRTAVRLLAAAATITLWPAVSAASASADIWFAAPGGNGPAPCAQADPCDIYDAVSDAPGGTRIAALGGTYELGPQLNVGDGIVLQGPYSGAPAVLEGDGSSGPAVRATDAGTRVTDFSIEQSGSGIGIAVADGAKGDRLISATTGPAAACDPTFGGTLRDSVCSATGAGGNGVAIDETAPGSGGIQLINVTAASAGDGGSTAAILVSAQGGAQVEVDGTNVIAVALGDAPDVAIGALAGLSSAQFDLSHSNFDTVADLEVNTTITPTDTNGNQSDEPVFTDASGGDFTETVSSPTVDAGDESSPAFGLLDVDRKARITGAAPDIGAHEFVPPPDTRAPNVSIPVAPKGVIKTKHRFVDLSFELASDEPDVVFECRINRLPIETCTSPVTYRLEATKGTGTTYTLTVRATDAAGNRSGKAIRKVQLIRKKG